MIFTNHFLARMKRRGVTCDEVVAALSGPSSPGAAGARQWTAGRVVVVTHGEKLVTVIRKARPKYKRRPIITKPTGVRNYRVRYHEEEE